MLMSREETFSFNGATAQMTVMRNSGTCWGRIQQGNKEYDVFINKDVYDHEDAAALKAFIRAAKDPAKVHARP